MTPSSFPEFPGFPDFRANVTFVPLQFFTVVLPHRSRGCVRLVGYMIRRLLGWPFWTTASSLLGAPWPFPIITLNPHSAWNPG